MKYLNTICDRCGSKQRLVAVHKEKLEMLSGNTSMIEVSTIICTNKACQKLFEEKLAEEAEKRLQIKLKKEEQEKSRRDTILRGMKKRKN